MTKIEGDGTDATDVVGIFVIVIVLLLYYCAASLNDSSVIMTSGGGWGFPRVSRMVPGDAGPLQEVSDECENPFF